MANPRKFSEKIALQKQKQDECSADFDKIMKEVKEVCNVGGNHVNSNHNSSTGGGGGGSGSGSGASGGGASPEGNTGDGSPTAYRESRGRSVGVGPMRRPSERKQDRSPYGSSSNSANINPNNGQNVAYLSPPMDNNWRRSNSDSALHQSLNMAVAAENSYLPANVHTLQANYQHTGQRSPSPHAMSRHLSPQAQRRKGGTLMQQQQQLMAQHQQHNHHHQQQQQHQIHHLQMQQQQMHLQQQQVQRQQQQQHPGAAAQHHHHQQPQSYNPKFMNCNLPANSLFKSLEQQMNFNNTGSLPDLTSVHFAASPAQQLQQQQQAHVNSALSPHSNPRTERDQSPSPFSPAGAGPLSPYQQQQNSPTGNSAVAQTSSPHMSFKNLSAAGTNPTAVAATNSSSAQPSNVSYNPLPTLGANSASSNLTDYRQPLNPPSPGSSPGLLTSPTSNELHSSAPASPIRSTPTGPLSQQPNLHGFDRYSPGITAGGGSNMDGGYNTLNPSFHNHFEQFSLGDSNSSPEQMQHQFQQQADNSFGLDFEDFATTGNSSQQGTFSHDFQDYQSETTGNTAVSTTPSCNNNNNNNAVQQIMMSQQLSNNNAGNGAHINNSSAHQSTNNNANLSQTSEGNSALRQDILSSNSPIPSPSPSSPLPIPISPQSPHHQQLSLSLHSHSVQHSPHHSPMHSPHHNSPISASSPGVSTLSGHVSPVTPTNGSNHHHQQQQQHQQQQPQTAQMGNTPTTPNIPSIIFSDYSSNTDYSREIFDSLDLDLAQIDVAGLQMLSDSSGIMIADPNIEDSFRRDLN